MKKYCFGVDLGGTTIKIGLFEENGTLLDKWEIPTDTSDGGKNIFTDVSTSLDAKLAEKSIDKADVCGVGFGVPGPVTPDGMVNRCVNLGWGKVALEEEFGKISGYKVKGGNDANVAALGEAWAGSGKDFQSILMVTLGTGIGGGIIIDGKILVGANGAGGEIGHMHVMDNEPEACGCGLHGCIEQYASATGVVRMAKRHMATSDLASPIRDIENLTAKDVFDAAKADDKLALEIVDHVCDLLGGALANISAVVNPEAIVIGGGVSKAGSILTDGVEAAFREKAFHACKETKICLANLGNDAGIYGAAKLVL